MSMPPEESRARVERVLEDEVARIDSPAAAAAVVEKVEQLAAGTTEAEQGAAAASIPAAPARVVEQVAATAPPQEEAAATLVTAAAEAVAPTPEAPAVQAGARAALGVQAAPAPPPVQRGRTLLRDAVLHRMGPLQALDARLFLAVNGAGHPRWLDTAANAVTVTANGGWCWAIAVALAALLGVPRARRALVTLLPSLAGATWIVEYPVKALFRRQRPFIDIVRALVVGKRPGSWSFPSGHTASSFAAAWALTTVWPRGAPAFLALAAGVGASRVYVGAHYPGDVATGAFLGLLLSEAIRRAARRPLRHLTRGRR